MSEPITVALTPAQADEFRAIDAEEARAREVLVKCPVARQYATRAILLGLYPLAMFNGQRILIDPDANALTFTPNVTLQLEPPSPSDPAEIAS